MNGGLATSIAQEQAQRDVGVDDQDKGQRPLPEVDYHGEPLSEVFGPPESVEQQRSTTEMDCHGGPVSEMYGPPEATASLAKGGLPLQARHQRRLQPPSGILSPPTTVISNSSFEEWLHSDEMKAPMLSLLEGQRQQPPKHTSSTCCCSGDRHVCLSRCVVEGCGGSARIISGRGIGGGTCSSAGDRWYCFPHCVGGGCGQGAHFR